MSGVVCSTVVPVGKDSWKCQNLFYIRCKSLSIKGSGELVVKRTTQMCI
jgi:hypothetical protein